MASGLAYFIVFSAVFLEEKITGALIVNECSGDGSLIGFVRGIGDVCRRHVGRNAVFWDALDR